MRTINILPGTTIEHAAQILCAHAPARFDAASVMSIFTANGYAVNVYCGEAFDPASRDIYARWLVGQGLSGIADGYAPHGMVREWADGWRAAFPAQVPS